MNRRTNVRGMIGTRGNFGLTVVEVVVALAVVVLVVGVVTFVVHRNRVAQQRAEDMAEQARLQALVDSEPYRVLDISARPLQEIVAHTGTVYVLVEVANPTAHALELIFGGFDLMVEGAYLDVTPFAESARIESFDGTAVLQPGKLRSLANVDEGAPFERIAIEPGERMLFMVSVAASRFAALRPEDETIAKFDAVVLLFSKGTNYRIDENYPGPLPRVALQIAFDDE